MAHYMWRKLCGATYVVQAIWRNLCGAAHEVQYARRSLRGETYVVQYMWCNVVSYSHVRYCPAQHMHGRGRDAHAGRDRESDTIIYSLSCAPRRGNRAQKRFMRARGAASAICLAVSLGTSSKF
eukprot:1976612-Pyramimonas_sp.AAC.1